MKKEIIIILLLIILIAGCTSNTGQTVNTSGTTINISEEDFDNLMDDLEDTGFEDLGGLIE